MSKKKDITLPTAEDEELLESVVEDLPAEVVLRGKRHKMHWLKRGTIRKITKIMNKKDNDDKASCQCVAAILLNGYWKIKFWWWALWRWYYYIKQYGDNELAPIIIESKKKIPLKDYLVATMSLTAMKDTMMQMTKAEANSILHAPSTDRAGS